MTPPRHSLLAAALFLAHVASPAATLCRPDERVAFACTAGSKVVSVCASGDLRRPEGRLIYRFGRDATHVELEHGADRPARQAGYYWTYNS